VVDARLDRGGDDVLVVASHRLGDPSLETNTSVSTSVKAALREKGSS
jgi:hypothetical protein